MRLVIRGGILWCATVLFCSRAFSQSNYYEPQPKVFGGGLILGANFSQVDGDDYYGYHKVGIAAGGVVYVHFTRVFGVSMELLYSQKGSRGEAIVESPISGRQVDKYFMDLNYAEVPVTLHALWHKLDMEAGASYGYLVKSSEWVQATQPVVIDPVANRFNTSDLDYIFGVGVRLYKGLHANVRFQYSITSIRPASRIPLGYGYGNDGQFNNLLNLRLIYLFE